MKSVYRQSLRRSSKAISFINSRYPLEICAAPYITYYTYYSLRNITHHPSLDTINKDNGRDRDIQAESAGHNIHSGQGGK